MKLYSFAPLVFVAAISAQAFYIPISTPAASINNASSSGYVLGVHTTADTGAIILPETAAVNTLEPLPQPSPSPEPAKVIARVKRATPPADTDQTTEPTPKPKPTSVSLPAHELDALFQKYGTEYGVSWEKLKVMAKCESGFRADAVGGGGKYGGMYQYLGSTWSSTRKAMGADPNPDLRFNPEEAIRTTAWKISQGGIGAWPVCGKK